MADKKVLLAVFLQELCSSSVTRRARDTVDVAAEALNDVTALAAVVAPNATNPVRMEGYIERVVRMYSDVEFQSHFRMTRSSVEDLCCTLAPHLSLDRGIAVQKKVLASLWMLGNTECFRSVADRFDLSKGSLHMVLLATCDALCKVAKDQIKFPSSRQELESIANAFFVQSGMPGVVGAIDGTHIPIPGTRDEFRASYINRKGFASMQLQLVCDSKLRILDAYTGWPGSVHDARVFRNSLVSDLMQQLPAEFHLLGDSAYPLSSRMLVPFRNDGHLGPVENNYNKIHASARVVVERTIGLFKCKFRRMKFLDMRAMEKIPDVIMACCVLHNFILEREGVDLENIDIDVTVMIEDIVQDQNIQGNQKRRDVALML